MYAARNSWPESCSCKLGGLCSRSEIVCESASLGSDDGLGQTELHSEPFITARKGKNQFMEIATTLLYMQQLS